MSAGNWRRRGPKMSIERAREMRQRRAMGEKLSVLAWAFRVSESTASRICRGILWPEMA